MTPFNFQYLIIGASGLVGRHITRALSARGEKWLGTYYKRPPIASSGKNPLVQLDITNPGSVERVFSKASPGVVFHAANLAGGVNFCESHPEKAEEFHLDATKNIGALCKKSGAKMVFISTDYVFDGSKDIYQEDDSPNPLNVYGRLKLEAEKWIRENMDDFLIIRTTNIYGWDPETVTPNYVMGLYRSLKDKKVFGAPSFLYGNPTYAGDLAEGILELNDKAPCGTFHVVGESFVNRLEWAKRASEILGLDGSLIKEIKKPAPGMIPRPIKSRLNTAKFTKSFETTLHNLDDGLKLMKSDMKG